jgi:hypothetical protein
MENQSAYSPLMRIIATVILITFTMLILEPAALAAQVLHKEHQQAKAQAAKVEAAKLSQTLQTVETTLTELQETLSTELQDTALTKLQDNMLADNRLANVDLGQVQQTIMDLKQQVLTLDKYVLTEFETTEAHIRDRKLPSEIHQRHLDAVTTYRQEMATLLDNLDAITTSKDKGQLREKNEKALKHLKPFKRKKHAPFDPNQLPFNIPKGDKVRPPLEKEQELKKLFPSKPVKVATTSLLPEMLMVAEAPDIGDLAATEDVQITPEIEALAQELEHNPSKIYNWVHNNIQFIPTHGSIQGSQMTLEMRAGNATDTASLQIALLRASGIHSRYAYGTVRIPIEKVMNWVGGVTAPEAATQILGQGGIPAVGLTQGGQIAFVKMEHVWVEAWVDFFPSRGAKHITGDTWISMDASFKQYEFTEGMNIQDNVPFDAEGFVDQIVNTAQINETEGWVSGIDQTFMETQLSNYQTQMEDYITQTNPDATVGEVLGTQTIIPINRSVLATSLPYPLIARGNTFKELPSNLRHYFKFSLYKNEMDRILEEPALNLNQSLPELAGKRLTLSFEPASESDRQVIESYLPEVPEGQELDPNNLPTSLPGYLINLKAQLKLDGEIIAESGSFTMGQELSSTTGITRMTGGWHLANNKPIAGEFYAFGIDLQGISAKQLETVEEQLEIVKNQIEASQFDGVTKDGVIGEILYAGILSYFAANDATLEILNKADQALAYRQPSFGTFSTSLEPLYSFGVPRQVEMGGLIFDVDAVVQSLWTKNNEVEISQIIGQQIGIVASGLEHQIPELLFSSDEHPGEAVSAVKALAVSVAEGQRIYQITAANVNAVLPVLNVNIKVKGEIQASVAVGKKVTISQKDITIGGWTGVGYIVVDPETGSGAYRISGGYNGGSYNDNYWSRYINFVSYYGIHLDLTAVVGLLLFGSIPKSWAGSKALLGSKNPLTSVLRGIYSSPVGKMAIMRAIFIPLFTIIGTFIGFYNVTILIEGLFYAIWRSD